MLRLHEDESRRNPRPQGPDLTPQPFNQLRPRSGHLGAKRHLTTYVAAPNRSRVPAAPAEGRTILQFCDDFRTNPRKRPQNRPLRSGLQNHRQIVSRPLVFPCSFRRFCNHSRLRRFSFRTSRDFRQVAGSSRCESTATVRRVPGSPPRHGGQGRGTAVVPADESTTSLSRSRADSTLDRRAAVIRATAIAL